MDETSSSDPISESTESSSNFATAIIASSVTVVIVIVTSLLIVFITVMLAKKYGLSKVVLQVTTDSIDIIGEQSFPSIVVHRYADLFMYKCKNFTIRMSLLYVTGYTPHSVVHDYEDVCLVQTQVKLLAKVFSEVPYYLFSHLRKFMLCLSILVVGHNTGPLAFIECQLFTTSQQLL